MAKQAIGLDIGTDAVRVAEVRPGNTPTLTRLHQVALPPGAVVEGQVVEPGEVAGAIRQLFKQAGIDAKLVHIGAPLSRTIVRTVETADVGEADLRAAVGFELEEHLPLSALDTAYDVIPLERVETDQGWRRRVLLAAAPLAAIRPSVAAVQQAGRRVATINVAPVALARLFPSATATDFDGTRRPSVDLLVSIGAGTMSVMVTCGGTMLFNRNASSPVGSRLTEGIEEQLAVGREVAELAKRRVVTAENRHLVAMATAIADLKLAELLDEVQDSLDYYRAQAFARPIDRIVLTGGGSLLTGIEFHLADRFGVSVVVGDPYQRLMVSAPKLTAEQRLTLAPFLASAVAFALDAETSQRIDLSPPSTTSQTTMEGRPILLALGLVTVAAVGGLTWMARSEAGDLRSQAEDTRFELDDANSTLAMLQARSQGALTKAEMRAIVAAADAQRVNWSAALAALTELSTPLGVTLGSPTATLSTSRPIGAAQDVVASVSLSGNAATLDAISKWIAAVEADERFVAVTARSASNASNSDATYRFSAEVLLTPELLLVPPDDPSAPTDEPLGADGSVDGSVGGSQGSSGEPEVSEP